MTGRFAVRDGHDIDALATDRYLDGLLAAHAHGGEGSPAASPGGWAASPEGWAGSPSGWAASEPGQRLRRTADRLARDLPRLHPSFRFEEALAARLADVAARMRLPTADGATGVMVPIAGRAAGPWVGGHDEGDLHRPVGPRVTVGPREPHGSRGPVGPRGARVAYGRPLLIGGAFLSAALSLAGAAYVAWRRDRPVVGPMARAVRAVARTRVARTRVTRTRVA